MNLMRMRTPKISALVAVKNEEKNIKRCLDSLKWVDEILIVDSNSKDRTLELSMQYKTRVYQFKKRSYLLREKLNFGIRKAGNEWILIIDADEEVTPDLKEEIIKEIKMIEYDGFSVGFNTFAFGRLLKGGLWEDSKVIRLFRKGKGVYKEMQPHSKISIKGVVGELKNKINHYVYPDTKSFLKKTDKYVGLAAPMIARDMRGGLLNKKEYRINIYTRFIEPILYVFWIFLIKKEYKDHFIGLWISMLMGYYLYLERKKVKILMKKNGS